MMYKLRVMIKVSSNVLLVVISSILFCTCEKRSVNVREFPALHTDVEHISSDLRVDNVDNDSFPILFSLKGLYGYLNEQFQIIIPPIYIHGFNYTTHGYALVHYDKGNRLREGRILDREGNIVFCEYNAYINILYDDIISYRPNGERYYRIKRFRDNTVIADGQGLAAGLVNNDIIILVNFNHKNMRVFIDSSGNRVLPDLQLRRLSKTFREERAVVIVGENWDTQIIDINGNAYGGLSLSSRVNGYFSEGLLPAETKDGRTGYINRDGEFAFLVPIVGYENERLMATDFNGGHALIQTTTDPPIWRVINNQGEYVSDELHIRLSFPSNFTDGLSCVMVENRGYGYLNTKGEMVIPPIFDDADSFYNGYARIVFGGRDGLINTEGKIFWCDELVMDTHTRNVKK